MKSFPFIIILAAIALIFTTCQKPARDNPWDELANPATWAPKNLQIEAPTITQRTISWEYTGENRIEGFKIDRKRGNENWVESYARLGKDERTFNDTITPDKTTTYQYRVYAHAGTNKSLVQENTSLADFPAPTNLTLQKLSDVSYKLNWTDNAQGESGFIIERKTIGEAFVMDTVDANLTTYTDPHVFAGKTAIDVQYRVKAFYGKYHSDIAEANTNASLGAPSSLEITKNSIISVTLNWENNSAGNEGFRIERKQGTGNWELLTTIQGTSYTDDAFALNSNISYRVAAYFGQYYSDFIDNTFNSQIPAPQNLDYTINSPSSITLNWDYPTTGHEGFKVERKTDNGSWVMLADNLNPEINNFTDNDLELTQLHYSYKIVAFLNGFQSNHAELIDLYLPSIGELYKGGIVFYVDGNGGGLVCAESDQISGAKWGCYGSLMGGTGTGIGTGAANTAAIIAGCSEAGIAARICNDLVLNGYSDWFLPSKDELNLMYQNLRSTGIGGFAGDYYWSSSDYSALGAWLQVFSSGSQTYGYKDYGQRVRAVRAF